MVGKVNYNDRVWLYNWWMTNEWTFTEDDLRSAWEWWFSEEEENIYWSVTY
jgi:hypothetical protein